MSSCCILGLDNWVDTSCSGKNAYEKYFIEGKTVTATGFPESLVSMKELSVANVLYDLNKEDRTTIFLEHNKTANMGKEMEDSLVKQIQSGDNGIRIDLCPKYFYPDKEHTQIIKLTRQTPIAIEYYGVLPYIASRRHKPEEIDTYKIFDITSKFKWYPYFKGGFFLIASY